MEFYQQFFDVDTDDVIKRLLWSVTPRPGGSTENFFKNKIRGKPDLYGPFWICVTLIFSVAISGNVASYLQVALCSTYFCLLLFGLKYYQIMLKCCRHSYEDPQAPDRH